MGKRCCSASKQHLCGTVEMEALGLGRPVFESRLCHSQMMFLWTVCPVLPSKGSHSLFSPAMNGYCVKSKEYTREAVNDIDTNAIVHKSLKS